MTANPAKVVLALIGLNHERFAGQCMHSLAEQTYKNFSVVFVDAGSSDRTFETVKTMLADAGIDSVCIQTRDNGVCRNLNVALRRSTASEYFTFSSVDDWLYPTSLEERVRFLDQHPECAMVYAPATLYFDPEGRYEPLVKPYAAGMVFEQLLAENFIPVNTAMIRTLVFDEVGVFDESLAVEDWDLWLRIAKRHHIGFLESPLAYYRQHGSNVSRNSRVISKAMVETLKKHIDHPFARSRYKRLQVQYSVNYDPFMTALSRLVTHGGADWLTVRQVVKLGVRRLTRGNAGTTI